MKTLFNLTVVIVTITALFAINSAYKIPGSDFAFGECVAAYDKFGNRSDILEKLKYKDKAKEAYGKISNNKLSISLAIMEVKSDYHNYTIIRQVERYISCVNNI
ncbi:hypothetical protein [Psychromonas sp. Urea-02u-13]|uniref:hypothetical protein n=1 Tax=Psychromonas sp. Urea-02u-13 TaxID=2058326 RepID=UPI000C3299A2|nr:hypothetical protein [Psychromonas sp. Urea-02u-13]PKG39472.1 hypothetical protein CXF74_08565 [Psychromonas sp. Urea-02u-13]